MKTEPARVSRRRFQLAVAVAAAGGSGLLAACSASGPAGQTAGTSTQPVELTYMSIAFNSGPQALATDQQKLPGLTTGTKYVIESRDFAKPWAPRIPEWSRVSSIISASFNAAVNGELSPKDAMTKATAEANALLPSRR
jgi:hypothetical protein